jgi:hypothetical protein
LRQLLDGADVQILRRWNSRLRHLQQVLDRSHRARAEHFSWCKFGRLDGGGKLGKERFVRRSKSVEQVGIEQRDELGDGSCVIDRHVLDVRVVQP